MRFFAYIALLFVCSFSLYSMNDYQFWGVKHGTNPGKNFEKKDNPNKYDHVVFVAKPQVPYSGSHMNITKPTLNVGVDRTAPDSSTDFAIGSSSAVSHEELGENEQSTSSAEDLCTGITGLIAHMIDNGTQSQSQQSSNEVRPTPITYTQLWTVDEMLQGIVQHTQHDYFDTDDVASLKYIRDTLNQGVWSSTDYPLYTVMSRIIDHLDTPVFYTVYQDMREKARRGEMPYHILLHGFYTSASFHGKSPDEEGALSQRQLQEFNVAMHEYLREPLFNSNVEL